MTEEHHCAIPSSPHPPQSWECPCGCRYWSDGKQWWQWPGESRYHRQRENSLEHPNRKEKLKPYHDVERDYTEVAEQIQDALARFKKKG